MNIKYYSKDKHECLLCGCLIPDDIKDILAHTCNPTELLQKATEKYEKEEGMKEEHKEKQVAIIQSSIVMPAVSPDEAVKRWKEYQDLKKKIVEKEDEQEIQGKKFLKKSYWRKLATFFNLSVEIVEEKSEILHRLSKEVIVYHFRARATAPNGRFAEGTGSCDIYDHATIHEEKFCTWDKYKKEWKEAEEKSLHNTRTTAETRAWNRAVSNLVGGGEVSAEEVKEENNGSAEHKEEFPKQTPPPVIKESAIPPENLLCSECNKDITEKVYKYSMEKFGIPLCFECQKSQ